MAKINYLSPWYKEISANGLANKTNLSVSLTGPNTACASGKKCTSLKMAEAHARQLLKEYPEMTVASIRDCSIDSDRTYGPYGHC